MTFSKIVSQNLFGHLNLFWKVNLKKPICYLVKTLCYSCSNQYGPPPVTNTIYLSYKSFRSCVPTLYWGQWESTPDNPASKIQ